MLFAKWVLPRDDLEGKGDTTPNPRISAPLRDTQGQEGPKKRNQQLEEGEDLRQQVLQTRLGPGLHRAPSQSQGLPVGPVTMGLGEGEGSQQSFLLFLLKTHH